MKQPVIDRNGAFADGYWYSDANIDLRMPNLVQWRKFRLGMSRVEVKQLLGPPFEGGAITPEALRAEDIETYKAQGLTQSQAEEIADADAARARESHLLDARVWTYGWLRFRSHPVLDAIFATTFLDDELYCIVDPFNKFAGCDKSDASKLKLDGHPTTPVILTPNDNASFEHQPFLVDYRWLPACGVYPMDYVLEVGFAQAEIRENEQGSTREWHVFDQSTTPLPHCAGLAPGSNPVRWRVKARNWLGESAWSEYRHYRFNV